MRQRLSFLFKAYFLVFFHFFSLAQGQQSLAPSLDVQVFRNINSLQGEGAGVMEYADLSSIPLFVAFPVVYTGVRSFGPSNGLDNSGFLLVLTQAFTMGATSAMKALIHRPRPFEALDDVRVKHQWSATGKSFPSGHTSQAFSIATFLALRHRQPEIWIPAFVWAGAIGVGRIYLGLHYPSDVVAGAVLGAGVALVVWSYRSEIIRAKQNVFPSNDSVNLARVSIPL
jgi:membrane-associated phospholipid phosphatase